jgi:hypothetical protein
MQFSESRGSLTNAVDRDGLSVAFPLECWKVLHNDGRFGSRMSRQFADQTATQGGLRGAIPAATTRIVAAAPFVRAALISFLHVGMTNHSIVDI